VSLRLSDIDRASLKQLREAVAGRNPGLPRAAALHALIRSEFPNKHRDLQHVLEDDAEPTSMRRLAARMLGRIESPAAREVLMRNATVREPDILAAILHGLGRIGDANALSTVVEARACLQGSLRRQADFAAAMIAHRVGLADDYLGDDLAAEGVPGVRPDCSIPLGFAPASQADVQTALIHLSREPFGVEYAETPAFHVRCQDENSVILLNRDLFATDAMDHLGRRQMIGGVVVTRIAAIYDYFPTLILLMTPRSKSHIDLRLYSPKGTLRYVGSGDLKSSGMRFQIRSVPLPGSVPVEVSGIYAPPAIRIESAQAEVRPREKRHPARLEGTTSET